MTTYLQSSPCKFGSFHSFPSQPWCLFLNEVLKRDQAFNMEMLAPMFLHPRHNRLVSEKLGSSHGANWVPPMGTYTVFAGFAVSFLPMYRNLFEGSRRYDKLQIMIYYPFSSILPYSCCACRHMYSGATIILLDSQFLANTAIKWLSDHALEHGTKNLHGQGVAGVSCHLSFGSGCELQPRNSGRKCHPKRPQKEIWWGKFVFRPRCLGITSYRSNVKYLRRGRQGMFCHPTVQAARVTNCLKHSRGNHQS